LQDENCIFSVQHSQHIKIKIWLTCQNYLLSLNNHLFCSVLVTKPKANKKTTTNSQGQAYLKTEKVHWKTFAYICGGYLNFLTASVCLGTFLRFPVSQWVVCVYWRYTSIRGIYRYTDISVLSRPLILPCCWPYGSTLNANESAELLSSASELMAKCGASRSLTNWEVLFLSPCWEICICIKLQPPHFPLPLN